MSFLKVEFYEMIAKFAFTLSILALPALAEAAVPSWKIVPKESELSFTAIQNNAPIKGEFKTFSGDISFDPDQLKDSKVNITVDTGSVSTAAADIADNLKSADWFDIKKFPKATFTAVEFKKTADKTFEAKGELTVRDKTIPFTLSFVLDEYSPSKAHITGTATLKRSTVGVGQGEWSSSSVVKDEVMVNFKITAEPAPAR
jgi:polyisoprenoid-binding protein YceI